MRATAFEFRFRVVLMLAIIVLGFWAPWIEWLQLGSRTTLWLWLGFELSSLGMSSTTGIEVVTSAAIVVAALAAGIRVWGTAYLGTGTVNNAEMKAGLVLADGPYRYVRNPLYIGSGLMVAAIAILMPASGALLSIVLLGVFLFRLILGEEAFLIGKLGAPYLAYRMAVPRVIPSFGPRVPSSKERPQWVRALLGELCPIGVFLSFAVLSWQFDAWLLIRAVLIGYGLSLVVRAFLAPKAEAPSA